MRLNDIIGRVKEKTGIKSLNEMQCEMAADKSRSTVLLAPTGSGKTLAFAISALSEATPPTGKTQIVILAPSRELVTQIAEVIRPIALPLKTVAFYGGHSMLDETKSLSTIPDVIVATPGRLLDHLNRSNLNIDSVAALVLDEYDKSLELGFHDEMKRICKRMGSIGRIILTSATPLTALPDFLHFDKHPTIIDYTERIDKPSGRMDIVEVPSPAKDKLDTLLDLTAAFPAGSRTIIFANHRESAERIHDALKKAGFPAGLYHGGLDQQQRELAVELLNNGTTPLLAATDLASRGLDIAGVEQVVHYHLPPTPENWTHRNGRTARQNATGTVYAIISEGENIPDYVKCQRIYRPKERICPPQQSPVATLYFNGGKKEKISRGDIAGFLMHKGGLASEEITHITVKDHHSLAAIPSSKVKETLDAIATHRIKGQRLRISQIT